jgi:hypothetical protein
MPGWMKSLDVIIRPLEVALGDEITDEAFRILDMERAVFKNFVEPAPQGEPPIYRSSHLPLCSSIEDNRADGPTCEGWHDRLFSPTDCDNVRRDQWGQNEFTSGAYLCYPSPLTSNDTIRYLSFFGSFGKLRIHTTTIKSLTSSSPQLKPVYAMRSTTPLKSPDICSS